MPNTLSEAVNPVRIVFLYFGAQCPWTLWMIEQAKDAADQLGDSIDIVDIIQKPEMAVRYNVFFPFMTIIDNELRIPGPIPAIKLVEIVKGGLKPNQAILKSLKPSGRSKIVYPLTIGNIADTCQLCNYSTAQAREAKCEWASKVKKVTQNDILGFIAYEGKKAIAVVEFLPSPLVPYPLPEKNPKIAFITCIYSIENADLDYREQVLNCLIVYLSNQGYEKIQV
ncbi:MAG: hypothetical protein ACFFBD_23115, partial [Candidatus Hodarchaeota archaeon]